MAVSSELFRQACSSFPTGVVVVTAGAQDGAILGLTTASLQSVSSDPPTVVFSVSRREPVFESIERTGCFGASILADDQTEWAEHYSLAPEEQPLELPGPLRMAGNGTAAVEGSLAFMECRVAARHEAGDHVLYLALVESVEARDAMPLVLHDGEYLSMGSG